MLSCLWLIRATALFVGSWLCWVTYPTSSFIPRREEFGVKDLRQYLQAFDDARPRTVEILIAIRDKDALPLHCLQLAPAGAALNQWHLYGIAQDCLACDPSLSHIHSLIRIPNCCTSQWTDLASQKKIKPRRGNGSNERPTGRSRQETRVPCFLVYAADPGSNQTHNVVGTVPGDKAYSLLWLRVVYDNAACASVHNLKTALQA